MINTDAGLTALLPQWRGAHWLALDTEADSLHAYPEKLCLMQLSTAQGDWLVDPLAGIDIGPLLELLGAHELIMHGADYDLRLLRKHHEFVPGAIFDTMLAARLIGHRQFGLGHLVKHFLGVELEKGPQKADWGRRPLTPRMATYALNDTHFLKPLADQLRIALETNGRLVWHKESCARLIEDCAIPPQVDPETVWRVKGSARLGRAALAILRELWNWREREAVNANRPPFFVLSHESLVAIADAAAHGRTLDGLLPPRMSPHRRSGVLAAVHHGMAAPPARWPGHVPMSGRRLTQREHQHFLELQKRRDRQAEALGIDPTLIASKAALAGLALDGNTALRGLMAWQRVLLEV